MPYLVLTIHGEDDRIHLGDDVIINAKIKNGQIKIGIQAPRDLKILRGKVKDRIEQQKQGEANGQGS